MKKSLYQNNEQYTKHLTNTHSNITNNNIVENIKRTHKEIVHTYLSNRKPNKITESVPPSIDKTEQNLDRRTRRTLSQIRSNHSPFLTHYLHKINPTTHPSPLCPLCKTLDHTTKHLFFCTRIHTSLTPGDLWTKPVECAALLLEWEREIGALGDPGGGPDPTH